jgi:hypothetical protein
VPTIDSDKETLMPHEMNLLPRPRELTLLDGVHSLPARGRIESPPLLGFTARQLQATLQAGLGLEWGIAPNGEAGISLELLPDGLLPPQGYQLSITADKIEIAAGTAVGLFYGVQTLVQLLTLYGRRLPFLRCRDWPDYAQRGVMLDISRDKVPTMASLYGLVDLLANWKINQLQLYTEHTFAYQNHPAVWAGASPMTAEEIRALDAYCKKRFIELVPNQNSFGHMRRWLVHDEYRHLAECPTGCDTTWGYFDEPFTLYPAEPGSLALLRELYDELLPNFSSAQFNVGCDETVDLGQGRSRGRADEIGVGRVYLDFLLQVYREVQDRGRTMQFWGDVIMNHPELAAELPRDTVALEWGYEAEHPFAEHGAILADSGIPFYVCPGTSSWNAVAGRTDNALLNLRNAAENGLAHGAAGYLITDWGDNGHWQPLPISYLGFVYGAAVSWAAEANLELDHPNAISHHAFRDESGVMGRLAYDLGNVYGSAGIPRPNGTILFKVLQSSPPVIANLVELEGDDLAMRLHATMERIDGVMAPLPEARMQRPDRDLIGREFRWAAAMLRHACQRMLWVMGVGSANSLAGDAAQLLREHDAIWHARNRPGGFKESQARLERVALDYD